MTLAEVDALIAIKAAQPAKAANAMGSVEQRSLDDLLALREKLAGQTASADVAGRGIRFTQLIPPGAT